MAPKAIGERVAAVEVEVKEARKDIAALAGTVSLGMERLRDELQQQSLNGRTANAKALVDDVGDEESRATLKAVIKGHDRREWLSRPILRWTGSVALLALGVGIDRYFTH